MKKLIAGIIALLSLAAQSIIVRADERPPVNSWSGWYTGLNAGYSWGRSETSASFFDNFNNTTPGPILLTTLGTVDMNGVIGGGQIGANWQNGMWVLGVEADLQASGQKGSKAFTCPAANCSSGGANPDLTAAIANHSQKLDWFGTLRARVGVAATPTILTYVTGGPAWGRIKTENVFTPPRVRPRSS
jgi:outer membrane immunogenic protein